MENQRPSVKFLSPRAVVHTCCYCSESCEAEVAQETSLHIPMAKTTRTAWKYTRVQAEVRPTFTIKNTGRNK